MNPKIISIGEKKFIGQTIEMSFVNNKTPELWKQFMSRKKEIKNIIGIELYSIEIYPPTFFEQFHPANIFKKWAAVEVSNFNDIPQDMEKLISPEGLYAVFLYKGSASDAPKIIQNIFQNWLPGSGYSLDYKPHFAVMGEKYKNNDPDSEEEFWIPIKK
jgi:AraC family transcriptional regulator